MIAMGGNSISPKSGTGRIEEQFERTREAFDGISHFIKRGYIYALTPVMVLRWAMK